MLTEIPQWRSFQFIVEETRQLLSPTHTFIGRIARAFASTTKAKGSLWQVTRNLGDSRRLPSAMIW